MTLIVFPASQLHHHMFVVVVLSWQIRPLFSPPLPHLRNLRDLEQLPLHLTFSNNHTQVKTRLLI